MGNFDIPHIDHGVQIDYRTLFFSNPDAALVIPKTIQAGYGLLKSGTAMAENDSAAGGDGKLIPYNPTAETGAENAPGRAYLVQDGASSTSVYVTMDDSYKFVVGDTLYVNDADSSARDLGAITAIDRTTYNHMALITVTNQVTDSYTTAQFAYVYVKGGDTCVGILQESRDTGEGTKAKGALGNLILGNCVLYTGMLINLDSDAITDLSAAQTGQFTYIR